MRSPVALCHVSRGCYRHQAITSQPPAGEPWKNSRCRPRELPSPSSSQPLKPPLWCTQRKLRMWENRGYWLQVAGVHIQGMTSVSPDSYFLPTHRKRAKFLNSRYLVSFINCHLLMFRLPCLLFKKKNYISWLSDMPLWNSFLSVIWDAVSQAWSPKTICQIKHNTQVLGWAFCYCFF